MQPPSLAGAAKPADVIEADRGSTPQEFFTLADAKNAIGMRLEQVDLDGYIQTLIGSAAAILEQSTGLELRISGGAEANYILPYQQCRALCIPESDVRAITAVVEHNAAGAATTLDSSKYALKRSFGRAYVLRTDSEYFEGSTDGVSVVVSYTRGVDEDSKQADMVRAAMAYLVKGLFDNEGTATDKMRSSPDFTRVVRLLRSQRSYI